MSIVSNKYGGFVKICKEVLERALVWRGGLLQCR